MSVPARRPRRAPELLALVAWGLVAGLTGCSSRVDAIEGQLVEIRAELQAVRAELLARGPIELPSAPAGPPPAGRDELELLQARVAQLDARLAALLNDRAAPPPAVDPLTREPMLVIPQPNGKQPPKGGQVVEVLSVGAGDLLLGRVGGELERLTLAEVEAPRRPEEYDQDPARRARHAVAFGEAAVASDVAWRQSRDFLFERVRGKTFALHYAGGRAQRSLDGSLPIVLRLEDQDLNAELVAAGLAVARSATYRSHEEAARKGRKGLFARP